MSRLTPEELRFREQRRAVLLRSGSGHGLDYVEPAGLPPEGAQVWDFRLRFVSTPPERLARESFRVLAPEGAADPEIRVTRVDYDAEASAIEISLRVADPARARRLRSDPEEYLLEIDAPTLDRFFSRAPFRFDGEIAGAIESRRADPEMSVTGDIDYLAKDYASFRQVMLERMTAHAPEWTERNPADLGVTVVETLAYAADYLSYFQDAVATEAYLDTARKRSSVRRHLRLLGHFLHEGCNARVWVQIQVAGDGPLDVPTGTPLLTRSAELPPVLIDSSPQHEGAMKQGSLVFETMHPVRLWSELNRLTIHTWGADDYVLPRGATTVALAGHHPRLAAGDVLILERVGEKEGESIADPRFRHAVRLEARPRLATDPLGGAPITELEFFEDDRLPFALTVTEVTGEGERRESLVARGNVVLADHGSTIEEELPTVRHRETYTPALSFAGITRREPFEAGAARRRPASAVSQSPEAALPEVSLFELHGAPGTATDSVGEVWRPRRDLLESQPFAAEFVAETEEDGSVKLRFGDGQRGRRPAPGTRFAAVYRVGNGPHGHVGHDSLAHIVSGDSLPVVKVRNPMPAEGARSAEPLERARLVAPNAFRRAENCVTVGDLERIAESHPGVLHAAATRRWTGSWETLYLYVQRPGGAAVDARCERRLRDLIEPRLLAGSDLEIRSPGVMPLEIRLSGRIEPSAVGESVAAAMAALLGDGELDDGSRGYFHPDRFGFGEAAFLDGVLDAAMGVPGVVSVDAEVFRPWGAPRGSPAVQPSVKPGPFEMISLRNRASEPQLGTLRIELEGGS